MIKTTTLREMFETAAASFYDVCQDSKNCPQSLSFLVEDMNNALAAIVQGDRKEIANLLSDGYAMMVVPNYNEEISELRVYDSDSKDPSVKMVFVGDEIY